MVWCGAFLCTVGWVLTDGSVASALCWIISPLTPNAALSIVGPRPRLQGRDAGVNGSRRVGSQLAVPPAAQEAAEAGRLLVLRGLRQLSCCSVCVVRVG
jgi:hypothetical protein